MTRKLKNRKHGSSNKPDVSARPEEEYKVGPGRPPKEYQWKPGQSGNPKGRKPKEHSLIRDLKRQFERAFSQKVKITQGEQQQFVTMWGAGMQQLAIQFAKGDRHARRDVLYFAERLGIDLLTPTKAPDEVLPADRQAILDAYVARRTQPKVSSAASPVLAPSELLDDNSSDEDENE
jgi:uncharacterized protein DUF5681